MPPTTPRDGKPGTTDQSPRWEGPEENRPAGYLPARDDPEKTPDATEEDGARQVRKEDVSRRKRADPA